jgi:hypothetical protein
MSAIIMLFVILYSYYYITSITADITKGLLSNMEEYGKDVDQKVIIDELQIYYSCCGANNYEDWFLIKWVPNGYSKDHPTNNITPFSCCRKDYLGPCRNEDVSKTGIKSLNNKGCAEIFSQSLAQTLSIATSLWILVLIIEALTLILFQYWRISIENALLLGHPKLESYAWLWGKKSLAIAEDAKRLLSPESVDKRSDYNKSEKYFEENKFEPNLETETELYDDTNKLTTIASSVNPPQPPSLPKIERLPAPPQLSPRSKSFYKRKLSVEKKKCKNCGQTFDDSEKHSCETHNHSLALISSTNDYHNSNTNKKIKGKANIKSKNQRNSSDVGNNVIRKSNKNEDSDGTDKEDESDNNSTNGKSETIEKPKRKYHERYFILKEIR